MGNSVLSTSLKAPSILKCTYNFRSNICPVNVFFRGFPPYFSKTKDIACVTRAWLCSKRLQILDWLDCSPDLSPIDNVHHVFEWKIQKKKIWTIEQQRSSTVWDLTSKKKKSWIVWTWNLLSLDCTKLNRGQKGRADALHACMFSNFFWNVVVRERKENI